MIELVLTDLSLGFIPLTDLVPSARGQDYD
jgi:hypothetical protein